MKKGIFLLLVAAAVCSMMSVTAFAHGGRGRGHNAQSRTGYEVCTVADCTAEGTHAHDGTWYYCANHNTGACPGGYCHSA